MDMTVILGIFTFFFFVTLVLMCFYRNKINVRLCNILFIVADFIAYSCWTYASYQKGWLGGGWLTLGNISPLTFTVILLTPFMNERIKDYAFSTIAFLNVGMFLAMLISPEFDYIFNFNTEATFVYTTEAVCHMICSLYGIYLVLSHQVKADFVHWIKSIVFLLSIITFGVVLNFVYHRNHFGMDPYNGAHIYMIDIFSGFWPTLIAYYFGVVVVLAVGMQGVAVLEKATARFIDHEIPAKNASAASEKGCAVTSEAATSAPDNENNILTQAEANNSQKYASAKPSHSNDISEDTIAEEDKQAEQNVLISTGV